jgi:hypothetical protein
MQNDAPFPLLTWEDTQATYFNKPVHARMLKSISTGYMPLTALALDPPVEPLTDAEKGTLVAWLEECGPPVQATACTP